VRLRGAVVKPACQARGEEVAAGRGRELHSMRAHARSGGL
jgi:hypothetical protein